MNEIWKIIAAFPDYEISNFGRIRRLTARTHGGGTWPGKILKLQVSKTNGYVHAKLTKDKKHYFKRVHVLVAETFLGPKPTPLHEVAHQDGGRTNNASENLRWATRKENHADKKLHGTHQQGLKNATSKLNDDQVREIRSSSLSQNAMARKLGVAQTTICNVRQRKTWKHIS